MERTVTMGDNEPVTVFHDGDGWASVVSVSVTEATTHIEVGLIGIDIGSESNEHCVSVHYGDKLLWEGDYLKEAS